ncbi:MAG: N-acetylmuramoyl-L-alanine amidase-like domain-containing protein, partial [Microcoleaceae cyanobacterium]
AIADYFLGTPYVANLLDGSSQEKLVINLKGFDCVLFVENILAIARGIAMNDYSFSNFVQGIENLRYRDGQINDYCSRLHYFSDWIRDNEKRGIVVNITEKLGGIQLDKQRDFMTNHRNSYPQLANDDHAYECMVNVEKQLSQKTFSYIPTAEISNIYAQLQPGDIIGVATDIRGLDFTHTGLVYQLPNGNKGLIHASPVGEVVISRDLQTYISRVESAIGIVVARPVDPRSLLIDHSVEQMVP